MTLSSAACRSREGVRSGFVPRDLRTPGAAEGRSGSVNRPKTDKG
jgi:hypothetical protein